MSDGTMFQRGPNGQVPNGQVFKDLATGQPAEYGVVPLNGQHPQHVTVHGDGWHRSWDNPGPTGDHSTIHSPRGIIQHPGS